VEVLLQHLLVVAYGVGGVFAFLGHHFRPGEVAASIGWEPGSPFQEEIAYANLGYGVAGLLCARQRAGWTATALASSIFYLGAALVHIRDLRRSSNTAINNAGAIAPDLLIPLTALTLLAMRERDTDKQV
jgi:hypothetical protein